MNYTDNNINLNIYSEVDVAQGREKQFHFPAYLENSALETSIIEQQMPFAPLSFTNDSIHLRNMYKVNFVFNVFAEDRSQTFKNYDNLLDLMEIIKPKYLVYNSQFIPSQANLTGLISISFKGLPRISKFSGVGNDQDRLKIHLTNFNYTPIQDMGFIEVPYDIPDSKTDVGGTRQEGRENKYYITEKMRLLPIGYKLTIAGKVLLKFQDTVRSPAVSTGTGGTRLDKLLSTLGKDKDYQEKVYNTARLLIGDDKFFKLSEAKIKQFFSKIKDAFDYSIIDTEGKLNEWYWDPAKGNSELYTDISKRDSRQGATLIEKRNKNFATFNSYVETLKK